MTTEKAIAILNEILCIEKMIMIATPLPAISERIEALQFAIDTLRLASTESKNGSRMWRVTVRTFLGAKRGEFLVEREKLKETVEGIATDFFTYDCEPEKS